MEIKLLTSMIVGFGAFAALAGASGALADGLAAYTALQQTVKTAAIAPPMPLDATALYPQIVVNPLNYQTIVNKKFQLASSFAPADLVGVQVAKITDEPLRKDAAGALERMFAAASGAGIPLRLTSAYRSFEQQRSLHDSYIQIEGFDSAEASSARPGYSEHQTGLAADFGALHANQTSAANAWVASNGPEFGFIIRYPAGKETITGYKYEPWHIRYVGIDTAKLLHSTGQVMEEYFKVPGGGYGQ